MSELSIICNDIKDAAASLGISVRIMEICGTHTVSIYRHGIRSMLPDNIRLISGPGCPVCVTAQADIDMLLELADRDDVLVGCYGDMLRVPGHKGSLAHIAARRNNIRIVNAATEMLDIASENPHKKVIFWAVGFETTAPMTAVALRKADELDLRNFFVFCRHKTMPAVMQNILAQDNRIDALLCPGHVAVITGRAPFASLPLPAVISGFGAEDILSSVRLLLQMLYEGRSGCINNYPRCVKDEGNLTAQRIMEQVFEPCAAEWRGMGEIEASGLALKAQYARFDAEKAFALPRPAEEIPKGCRCGDIIRGNAEPSQCALFGGRCTPLEPVGPCMVSAEGACAAYYKYGRQEQWRI